MIGFSIKASDGQKHGVSGLFSVADSRQQIIKLLNP